MFTLHPTGRLNFSPMVSWMHTAIQDISSTISKKKYSYHIIVLLPSF